VVTDPAQLCIVLHCVLEAGLLTWTQWQEGLQLALPMQLPDAHAHLTLDLRLFSAIMQSIEDASALRRRISECFERAALPYVSWDACSKQRWQLLFCGASQLAGSGRMPSNCLQPVVRNTDRGARVLAPPQLSYAYLPPDTLDGLVSVILQTPEEERKRLLSFVVCGGGPTGVEVAAEMHDMIFDDLKVGPDRQAHNSTQHQPPFLHLHRCADSSHRSGPASMRTALPAGHASEGLAPMLLACVC
jgi:hypothetical protein